MAAPDTEGARLEGAARRRIRPLTSPREALSYAVAHLIRIAATYALSTAGTLVPLYQWVYRAGGPTAFWLLGFCLGALWATLALPLFLIARGFMGGAPGSAEGRATTTTGAEVGAYAVAHLIGVLAVSILTATALSPLYAALHRQGSTGLGLTLALSVAFLGTLIMFAIFVYLRRAFSGDAKPAGDDPATVRGGEAGTERPDLVGVGGWLLFFCVSLTILAPIVMLISVAVTIAQWPTSNVLSRYPGLGLALALEIIGSFCLTIFAVIAGCRLWQVRPGAVALAKQYLVAQLILTITLPFIEAVMAGLPADANAAMAIESVKGFAGSLIAFLIWFNYLNKSVRVRVTFRR
jgi:hypothetical protein